jgi:REP element-mobilizing transposase RayT
VGAFKTVSTKRINELRGTLGIRFWQRNYWEHIIRDEQSLNRIREYIQNNPARWAEDQLHPDAPPNAFNRWQPPES